jgi:hypothetical protein
MAQNLIALKQIRTGEFAEFISGVCNTVISDSTGFAYTVSQAIASGEDIVHVAYGRTFPSIPKVFVEIRNEESGPILTHMISGRSTTSCYVLLSNDAPNSDYFVDVTCYL